MGFKTEKFKKLQWVQNASKECGAQSKVIEEAPSEDVVVKSWSKKRGQMWVSCKPEKCIKLLESDVGLYEVLCKFPQKVYFDIDKTTNLECDGLEQMKSIIEMWFPGAVMAISGSKTESKHSYHIVLTNYKIDNEEQREVLKWIVKEKLCPMDDAFDWKVYTSNRCMKCVNQSKHNDSRIQEIIENDDLQSHLISAFIPQDAESIVTLHINAGNTDSIHNSSVSIIDEFASSTVTSKVNILDLPPLPEAYRHVKIDNVDLHVPENLLRLCPLDKSFNHTYTWQVARFCYYNDVDFATFYQWYRQKHDDVSHYRKWKSHWEKLKDHPPVTVTQMMITLEKYYPNIRSKQEVRDFVKLSDVTNHTMKQFDIEALSEEHFLFTDESAKAKVFHIGMGGGKTTNTINFLQTMSKEDKSFIWMTPNVALAENTFERMRQTIQSVRLYNETKKAEDKAELIQSSENVIICLNSLKYVTKTYSIVVIDEVETFLRKWCFNETLEKNDDKQKCWDAFLYVLHNADHIILLDAFITNVTLQFFESRKIDMEYYRRIDDKKYNPRTVQKFSQKNHMIHDCITQLKEGKKVLIFYPYCNGNKSNHSMKDLQHQIETKTGKRGLSHNANTSDKTKKKLKNPNEEWGKCEFVMCNTVVTVGVNFDIRYFDQVYLFVASFNHARDIVQFSFRARYLKDNLVKCCLLNKDSSLYSCRLDKASIEEDLYKQLRDDVMIEDTTPQEECLNQFFYMAGYDIKADMESISRRELATIRLMRSQENFYDYNQIESLDDFCLQDAENEFYSNNCSFTTKLVLRKYYYDKKFKPGVDDTIKAEIWNNNYLNVLENVRTLMHNNDELLNRLKDEYKWEMHFPTKIKGFKFTKDLMRQIFDSGLCSKNLNTQSKDHLVLKSYINCYFNTDVIKSTTDRSRHVSFSVNEKFKKIYILILSNIYQYTPPVRFVD